MTYNSSTSKFKIQIINFDYIALDTIIKKLDNYKKQNRGASGMESTISPRK